MRWCSNRLAFTWGKPSDDEQASIAENMVQYWQHCTRFVAMRHTDRADDLTSELLAANHDNPQELTYREVESIIYGLSFAGHEIVSNFVGNALLNLLARLEARIALEALSRRIPSLRLVENQQLRYSPNITFRGPAELLVDWDR